MASGFFLLFDDIAALMDDVAVMGKIATKKTAGILGDDLAVNAEKSTGFVSDRELPVIWAIMKGSFINKLIILPLIVLLSAFAPQVITPILMLGGLYLAYEGAEKIFEFLFPHHHEEVYENTEELTEEEILILEKGKIKSAIMTDFILSLEIVIIALSTVKDKELSVQIPVLVIVAIAATVGVYGIVALIVRLDDMGYAMMRKNEKLKGNSLAHIGKTLIWLLPWIIKVLAVVGTIAMLMVAGGIYHHNIHQFHDWFHAIPSILTDVIIGVIVGFVVLGVKKLVTFII